MPSKPTSRTALITVLVLLVLAFVLLSRRSAEQELVEVPAAPLPVASASTGTAEVAASEPEPAVETVGRQRELVTTIKSWLSAWSEQRVDDYLDHYAKSFQPPEGISRRHWEVQRRERISAPRFVRLAMTGLETESLGDDRAHATFLQHYRSDGYTDTVRKSLELVWQDGRWRIERESSESAR